MHLVMQNKDLWSAMSSQTIERCSAGTSAVLLLQSFLWLSNIPFPNTGYMPRKIASIVVIIGVLYSIAAGYLATTTKMACLGDAGLHHGDVWFPFWLAMVVWPFTLYSMAHPNMKSHGINVTVKPFGRSWSLYAKAPFAIPSRTDIGLRVRRAVVKDAPIMLDFTGIRREAR